MGMYHEELMMNALKIVIAELAVAALGVSLISGSYLLLIPRYLNDQGTYSALVIRLGLVAAMSAYIARRISRTRRPLHWMAVASISVAVTVVTVLVSPIPHARTICTKLFASASNLTVSGWST